MSNAHVVLFPFTWIAEDRARELSAWFGSPLMLLQTTGRLSEDIARLERQGFVSPKCPVPEMNEALQLRIEACRKWMEVHPQQQDMAFLKAIAHLPSDDEAMSAHIRGEILRYGRHESPAATKDPLLDALVFLHLAEELDRQQVAVETELKRVEHLETSVFRKLIGEDSDTEELSMTRLPGGILEGDTEPDHPEERLRAWALLALQEPDLPNVWLTTSRLVMESIIEAVPEIGERKVILPWKEDPELAVRELCNLLGAEGMCEPFPVSMSIDTYVLEGRSPKNILNALRSRSWVQTGATSDTRTVLLHLSP